MKLQIYAALLIFLPLFSVPAFAHGDETHDALLSQIQTCATVSEGEKCYTSLCESGDRMCLEDVMEVAVSYKGPEFALQVLAVLDKEPSFTVPDTYTLARAAGRMTARNISSSGEAFLRCTAEFQYGCPYGFFEEVLGQESVEHASMKVCDSLQDADRDTCYHRMGHALMKHTEHNLTGNPLIHCDALAAEAQQHCWDGVFMEAIYWFEAGGTVTSWFSRDNPLAPCDRIEEKYKEKCYSNHGSYLIRHFNNSAKKALKECAGTGNHATACRESVNNPEHSHSHGMKHPKEKKSWWRRFIGFFTSLFGGDDSDDMVQKKEMTEHGHEMEHNSAEEHTDYDAEHMEPAATIMYREGRYVPETVTISVGQKVTWINEDQAFWPASNLHPTHKLYPGSNIIKCGTDARNTLFDACEAMGPGAEYSFVFQHPGEWRFHDHIQPRAQGTVIVQ